MKRELTFKSRVDGLGIGVVAVLPENGPKAVIQLAHGVCGCKERFLPFMEYMARNGIACVLYDEVYDYVESRF